MNWFLYNRDLHHERVNFGFHVELYHSGKSLQIFLGFHGAVYLLKLFLRCTVKASSRGFCAKVCHEYLNKRSIFFKKKLPFGYCEARRKSFLHIKTKGKNFKDMLPVFVRDFVSKSGLVIQTQTGLIESISLYRNRV